MSPAKRTYTNPLGDIRIGDPFVLRHEEGYCLFGSAGRGGFACWTSPDLVEWTSAGLALEHTADSWGRRNFWAPEVTRYRGRFYMVYSAQREAEQGFRLCLAVGDAPAGPYTGLRAPWLDIGWSTIDADLFVDDDGAPYIYFTKVGVEPNPPGSATERHLYGITHGARLDDDLSEMLEGPVLCVQADQPWELVEKDHVLCNEGPFVFRRGDAYYMTYSSGHYASPAYGIGYATAPSPLGPWTKSTSNPLVASDPSIGVSGPGHNNVTLSPDGQELWMVYHAHADPNKPSGNRTLNIDRLLVLPDGALKLEGPSRTPRPVPSGSTAGAQ